MSLPLVLSNTEFTSLKRDLYPILLEHSTATCGKEHFKGAKILSFGDVQKMAIELNCMYQLDDKNHTVIFTRR